MSLIRSASILMLGAALGLGTAQTPPATTQEEPSQHQGMGNQRGAGTSPENSSNGGSGTMNNVPHSRTHRHKRRSHKKESSPSSESTTSPTTTPQQ